MQALLSTPFEESPGGVVKDAGCAASSEYFSPHIEMMMQSISNFLDEFEHEIEHSKCRWS
jgi:hypothetical protein